MNQISIASVPGRAIKLPADEALAELKRLASIKGTEIAINCEPVNINEFTESQLLPDNIYTASFKLRGS